MILQGRDKEEEEEEKKIEYFFVSEFSLTFFYSKSCF